MKKTLVNSCIALSLSAYSFWPMKLVETNTKLDSLVAWKEIRPLASNRTIQDLRDTHTFCVGRMCLFKNSLEETYNVEELDAPEKFLFCSFKYTKEFFENLEKINSYKTGIQVFYLNKSPVFYDKSNLIVERAFGSDSIDYFAADLDCKYQLINFKQSFSSLSGVMIENTFDEKGEGKVILSKNGKQIDLTSALRNYFNPGLFNTNFAQKIHRNNSKKQKDFHEILNHMKNPVLASSDLERLNSSTVLAVWCLIPREVELKDTNTDEDKMKDGKPETKIVERQMLGLARDKEGQLFHFTTDLCKDISILMRYAIEAPKVSSN